MPDSASLILLAIRTHGPLSQKSIVLQTGIPERTVRYNLSRLALFGLIEEKPNCNDLREKLYSERGAGE